MKILIWEARQKKKLSTIEMAKLTGIGKSTLNYFESGFRYPRLFHLVKIAQALELKVSDLYLSEAERLPYFEPLVLNESKGNEITILIKEVRTRKDISLSKLADLTGISRSTINDYENHKYSPPLDDLEKIAIALYVSIESLYHLPDNNV